ncbi:MAG TPA: helical backbone metal receptor [Kofleriaceae bacterium]|nr:helical backbone metal receptor [Kofleriaceae bacterium]
MPRWCRPNLELRAGVSLVLVALLAATGCEKERSGAASGEGPPGRIVTLTPSSTELVVALGGLDRLVGVDSYSTEPAPVAALPRVGDFLAPNLEAIIRLEPDLVVLDQVQAKVATSLNAAGIRTLTLDMHTLADVRAGMLAVGEALGAEAVAAAAVAAFDQAVDDVSRRGQSRARPRPRVLAVVDRSPGGLRGVVVAGPGSYIDELLAIIGADNVMAGSPLRYTTISAEQIERAAPTDILDSVHGADPVRARADWSRLAQIPAVARGRIHQLADQLFAVPGPRVGEALHQLEQVIYGISPE